MNKVVGNKYKKYKSRCYICNKNILVFLASLENKRNFCSNKCENKWKSIYWKKLQKNKSFGFKKGHKMNIGNKYAVGNHPKSEWKNGHKPWNKDMKYSEEVRKKMPKFWLGKKFTKKIKLKISLGIKNFLNTHPEQKKERIRKLLQASSLSPNKSEKKLIYILSKILPREYKFVGNGKIFIENFIPDFINVNGQKKIIEFFGTYWHKKPKKKIRDKRRLKTFKKYGYKTLIIWSKELKNRDILKEKILKFNEQKKEKKWAAVAAL